MGDAVPSFLALGVPLVRLQSCSCPGREWMQGLNIVHASPFNIVECSRASVGRSIGPELGSVGNRVRRSGLSQALATFLKNRMLPASCTKVYSVLS
ncbi:MAG: hypothetical protein J3Q66DRAFT_133357 [Benniella sp.]|nr:MAG: hypothetical protein J3Q66DRAFT_133357 [Benniella sp.]